MIHLPTVKPVKLTSGCKSNPKSNLAPWAARSWMYIGGWSQKKCTRWQHCVNNDAICPAISAVVLENLWKLVECNLSPELCARGNDRALKWWLFISQVPWLMTISARTSKLKHYAGKLQWRSTVRWWKCVVWKLLTEAQFHAGLSAFVREGWA